MLPRPNRIKKNTEIERVFKRGKKFKEDFLILIATGNNLNQARFGFIVSQKISKKAVLRNKLKRRLREIVRSKLKEFKKGRDVIVMAVPGLETKDFWEIKNTINKLFKKAKCLKN